MGTRSVRAPIMLRSTTSSCVHRSCAQLRCQTTRSVLGKILNWSTENRLGIHKLSWCLRRVVLSVAVTVFFVEFVRCTCKRVGAQKEIDLHLRLHNVEGAL